jgi:hypothetical protein
MDWPSRWGQQRQKWTGRKGKKGPAQVTLPEWLTWSQDYKHKISWKSKWHVANDGRFFFCPDILVSHLKLSLKVCLNTLLTVFSFKSCFWGGQFSHFRHVKTGREIGSYPGHCRWRPWAGPFALLAKAPFSWDDGPHDLNLMWTQSGKTNDRISILYLKCPMHLKFKFQVF